MSKKVFEFIFTYFYQVSRISNHKWKIHLSHWKVSLSMQGIDRDRAFLILDVDIVTILLNTIECVTHFKILTGKLPTRWPDGSAQVEK